MLCFIEFATTKEYYSLAVIHIYMYMGNSSLNELHIVLEKFNPLTTG